MERVVTDDRVGGVTGFPSGLVERGTHVHRHRLDSLRPLRSELVEEAVQGRGVLALLAPHEPPGLMRAHQRDVGMAPAPRHFVDADDEQVVQPVGVQPVDHDAFDDAPGGVPVDTDQAPERGLVHGGGQPPDQVLEVAGET